MKGYKGFKKGLICDPTGENPKQYAENTVFEEEKAEICKSGMHFCKNPIDILDYYPLIDANGEVTEFAEVEALEEARTDDNKKFCTKKLKIGAKLDLHSFVKASLTVSREAIEREVKANGQKRSCFNGCPKQANKGLDRGNSVDCPGWQMYHRL